MKTTEQKGKGRQEKERMGLSQQTRDTLKNSKGQSSMQQSTESRLSSLTNGLQDRTKAKQSLEQCNSSKKGR